MNRRTYALDFETYYDKEVSITTLGTYGYLHHPHFHAYMVAVVELEPPGYEWKPGVDKPFSFCGEPENTPWETLRGARVVSHNASFDEAVFERLVEQGKAPADLNLEWCCTADMAAYLGAPRSLKDACQLLLGRFLSKEVRDNMCGMTWAEAVDHGWEQELKEYCMLDTLMCGQLWKEHSHKWPEHERRISAHTRRMAREGIHVDQAMLEESRRKAAAVLFDARDSIPWAGSAPLTSRKAIATQCAHEGIPMPSSLAKDNPDTVKWVEKYGEKWRATHMGNTLVQLHRLHFCA